MDFIKHFNTPELIVIIGIPGSEKSHWTSNYNKNNKYTVVSPDVIRMELTNDISDQSQNVKVWQITKERVIDLLKKGKNVILDSTMTNPIRRQEFIRGLPTATLKAKIFFTDPEVSKARIVKDIQGGKNRANVPVEVIDRMNTELMNSVGKSGGGSLDVSAIEREGFEVIDADHEQTKWLKP